MIARRFALLLPIAALGCSTPDVRAPSLAPRAAEAIDPRIPVPSPEPARVADAALQAQLRELLARARAGDSAFQAAAGAAERLAAAAGEARSESWVTAQEALSAAVAARGPTSRALGDIDELAATRIARLGGMAPGDSEAIRAAAAEVAAIERRQVALIDRLQARLGSQ